MKNFIQITFLLLFPICCFSQDEKNKIIVPFDVVEVPLTNQECNNIEFRTKRVGTKEIKYIYKIEEHKKCIKDFIREFVKEDLYKFVTSERNRFRVSAIITFNSEGAVTDVKTRSPYEEVSAKMKEKLLELPDFTPASQRGENVGCILNVSLY